MSRKNNSQIHKCNLHPLLKNLVSFILDFLKLCFFSFLSLRKNIFSISVPNESPLVFRIFFLCICLTEFPAPLVLLKDKPVHTIGRIRPPKRGVFQPLLHRPSSGTIPLCSQRSLCWSLERRTMPVYSSRL